MISCFSCFVNNNKPKIYDPNSNKPIIECQQFVSSNLNSVHNKSLEIIKNNTNTNVFEIGTRVSVDSNNNVKDLFLDNCYMNRVPIEIIWLKTLENLWLSNNNINRLPPQIECFTNMKSLWLNHNKFEIVNYLPSKVTNLYLQNNPLRDITCLRLYTSIQKLQLNDCQLTSLPEELCELKQLKTLELHCNQIMSISPSISNLQNLGHLSLHNNKLKTIPKSLGNLKNLYWLSMHYNVICSLPGSIGGLENLKRLSLHGNYLQNLPKEIGQCTNIIVLSLFHNKVKTLPIELFKGLVNCKKLAIHDNCLYSIPPEISCMKSLEDIWIYDNSITVIPDEMTELTSLKTIHANTDTLSYIPSLLQPKVKNSTENKIKPPDQGIESSDDFNVLWCLFKPFALKRLNIVDGSPVNKAYFQALHSICTITKSDLVTLLDIGDSKCLEWYQVHRNITFEDNVKLFRIDITHELRTNKEITDFHNEEWIFACFTSGATQYLSPFTRLSDFNIDVMSHIIKDNPTTEKTDFK